MPPRSLLSIDPGLDGTGWAFWDDGELQRCGVVPRPMTHPGDTLLHRQCGIIEERMRAQMHPYGRYKRNGVRVILEFPQQMSNLKGIAAQKGSVYRLAFLVGYLVRALEPMESEIVLPVEWKGQLPKAVVQDRVSRILGKQVCEEQNIRTHAWDAVGIGLWRLGRWHGRAHGRDQA